MENLQFKVFRARIVSRARRVVQNEIESAADGEIDADGHRWAGPLVDAESVEQ